MHVFITGASGYVGSVITERLVARGLRVSALARSDAAAAHIENLGAEVRRGSLSDLDALRSYATEADAVIYTAIDYSDPTMRDVDEAALTAILDELDGSSRRFIYTSSTLVYGDTGTAQAREEHADQAAAADPVKPAGDLQVRSSGNPHATVVRPGLVFGRGGSGLVTGMLEAARTHGAATYVGDGTNHWSTIHVDDLADLYLHLVEHGTEESVLNATAEPSVSMKDIATAIAENAGVPAVSLPLEQATAAMGPLAAQLTQPLVADSTRARDALNWKPQRPSILHDVARGSYTADA